MVAPAPVTPAPAGSSGKRTLLELLAGAVIGFVAWSFVGPKVISWWYEPPASEALSCASSVTLALKQFVWMQLVITLIGAVVVALFMFLVRRKLKSRNQPPAGTTAV